MGLCHGIIMLKGGSSEREALDTATSSKLAPAPPSREALTAMGEDGSGLTFEELMRRMRDATPAAGRAEAVVARGDGEHWEGTTAGGAGRKPSALHGGCLPFALRIPV